jgi:hypothetical protein
MGGQLTHTELVNLNNDLDKVINNKWATCDKTPDFLSISLWTGEYNKERIKEYIASPGIPNLQKFLMNIIISLKLPQNHINDLVVTFIEFIFLIPITCFDNTTHFNEILNHPNNLFNRIFALSNSIRQNDKPAIGLQILKKIYYRITRTARKYDVLGYKSPEICYTFTVKPKNM